jgi:hypothetical protein
MFASVINEEGYVKYVWNRWVGLIFIVFEKILDIENCWRKG